MPIRSLHETFFYLAYFLPALTLRALNFRVPDFFITRIGHLLLEPDCLIKEEILGLKPRRKYIMLASSRRVANRAVLKYWGRYFFVISSPLLVKIMRPLMRHPLTKLQVEDYAATSHQSAKFAATQAAWGGRSPLLTLSVSDVRRGEKSLRALGVPENAWFVCIHSREGGYSTYDEQTHSFRNSDIEDYALAVEYIVSRGGWCIRVGDPSMRRAPEIKGLVDYAHHPLKSDWLDIFLGAKARFFLGNTSGALFLSATFGVPVACANLAPMAVVFPFGERDIGIPKLYKRKTSGEFISFSEILASPMADFRQARQFVESSIELVNNSPEEIRDLAAEQYELTMSLNRRAYSDEEQALQASFKALFRPGHYTYGSSSRIGRAFLERYRNLLS